jgi:hypothetical protein
MFITVAAVIRMGLKNGCRAWTMDSPYSDSFIFQGVSVLGKSIEPGLQTFHSLLQLHNGLLESLKFDSRRSLPVSNSVVEGVVADVLIGHNQDNAYSDTN